MAQRETRKAGIIKTRYQDPKLQRSFDAIIERLEVLDGLRGDALDKAVTYRDLSDSGFTVSLGGAIGTPAVTGTPGTTSGTTPGGGDGPAIGPAAAPQNLTAADVFLAILLTWDNPAFNLQHIEVWRSSDDVLANAVLIGTTVSPQYVDYVGASASYYYWVRAVGTDGTFSAYNATEGTLGTTGIDPSEFEAELNISAANLDAALTSRIDLIDNPTTGLVDRLAVAEGDIITLDGRTDTLESSVSGLSTTIDGNTTNIAANASLLSTQQTSITALTNDLAGVEGDLADNTAAITVNSQNILELQSSVGALDAEAGISWEFTTDLEGFTANNATATWDGSGVVIFTPTNTNPQLLSPVFTNISGSINTQVVARVRLTTGVVSAWEGNLRYQTSSGWFSKAIADPQLALSTWKTLTWNMSGESAWLDGGVTQISLDLVSNAAGVFEVDWIQIARVSTSALSTAISALDTRVTVNESGISSNSSAITNLQATVDNVDSGVSANATAIAALLTDVSDNTNGISANSSAITALESTVNDGTDGVVANALAIDQLQTDVSTIDGVTTASASDITQLIARINGGYASIVNPLNVAGENFGTSYSVAELQTYNVGGRSGAAARIDTNSNAQDYVYRADGGRIYVHPNDIYEVKFSVYHNRPTDAGSFYAGLNSYNVSGGGSAIAVYPVDSTTDTVGTGTANPYWLSFSFANHDEEWLDVTCYIIGSSVDPSACPEMRVNGILWSDLSGYAIRVSGFKLDSTAPWVHLRFLNYNSSPSYGDNTTTTTYVTNLRVHRIDSAAENYAAIETQASVTANTVGDLSALYAVKAELNASGDPYVTGFGLAADIIDGQATSAFGIRADQFFIANPNNPTDTTPPFSVGLVDGSATVGINGSVILDGTLNASSIVADSIGAREIDVTSLSALSANMGTLTSGLIRTAASPAWRVEIQDTASTIYPIWYGSGTKSAGNGRFYVTSTGDVTVKGLFDAGMIKQSYFTPADTNQFRIACDYPSNYSGGVYTGKKAHLMPTLTTGFSQPYKDRSQQPTVGNCVPSPSSSPSIVACGYHTDSLRLYSPVYAGNVEYGRLGTLAETLVVRYSCTISNYHNDIPGWMVLKYRYDGGTWRQAFVQHVSSYFATAGVRNMSANAEDIFVTRQTPTWNYLDIRLGVGRVTQTIGGDFVASTYPAVVSSVNLSVSTANFGYADLLSAQGVTEVTGTTEGQTGTPVYDPSIYKQYL